MFTIRHLARRENRNRPVGPPGDRSIVVPVTPRQVALCDLPSLCLVSGLVMTTKAKAASTDLNFETGMDRLEKIVEQMESGQLPLEDLIVRYEEGMNLVKVCQERLASAEQKIDIIARNSAGKAVVKAFDPAAESKVDGPAPSEQLRQETNEVRLF